MLADYLKSLTEAITLFFEAVGVGVIVAGFAWALWRTVRLYARDTDKSQAYQSMRTTFGRSVLLGLEILVAADIIRTVATDPSLDGLYVLGLLVLIRTFLSFSIDVELEGAWPWRKRAMEMEEKQQALRGPGA